MMKMIVLSISFTVSVLFAHISVAGDRNFDELLHKLSNFNLYQANFVQTSADDKGQSLQTLDGRLVIERPNRFFWKANEPTAQLLVCDGETIWHFDEDLEQVIVQKYAEQAGQSPLLLILDDAKQLKSDFELLVPAMSKAPGDVYHLKAKDANAAVKVLEITFIAKQLAAITFTDALQQVTHIEFSQVELNKAVDEGLFTFSIPKGADVLYQ